MHIPQNPKCKPWAYRGWLAFLGDHLFMGGLIFVRIFMLVYSCPIFGGMCLGGTYIRDFTVSQ